MSEIQERRAQGAGRVPVETLVEVCGNEPGIPAFEAEAVDVSARGMHLRTAYLPDQGAPLVCRFEEEGREIVVEGRVAWRHEGSRGGEFGVEFTALDSGSVGALRDLCEGARAASEPEPEDTVSQAEVGSRVRLHIEGLGSPMKARVRESGTQKVQVGSNLEFLKVGRRLEVEDLEQGGRRNAHIDGVSVAIDPTSNVPQLVVQLRFEGVEDSTPEPSVTGVEREPVRGFKISGDAVTTSADVASAEPNDADDEDADAAAMRGRLSLAATNAGEAMKSAGQSFAKFSGRAAVGFGELFKGASAKVLELTRRGNSAPKLRKTSPPPSSAQPGEGHRLRPQSGSSAEISASKLKPMHKKLILGASGVVLLATVTALAAHRSAPPGQAAGATAAAAALPPSTGAPLSATPPASDLASGAPTANVPLFGPTPMATMEPAPLSPSPEAAGVEASERAAAKLAAPSAGDDEAFSDEGGDDSHKASESADKAGGKPENVAAWGHGKIHTPTIYRLRLDGDGSKLQGVIQPTGFVVVIPGRKVMEQGGAIAKRDPRVKTVHTSNSNAGAEVTFKFRDEVPAYRVRLRRDYVEFLISESDKGASKKVASKTADKGKVAHKR
ncbi:MAG TPA: PilZ domain-containing protein [Polyangiaceae bacterium]|jgi:hypothetical protein